MANSKPLILMLEDEVERLDRFANVLVNHAPDVELRHWRTSGAFIHGFKEAEQKPILICLDHDLFVWSEDEPDPGDGRDVSEFLASQNPCCHVIIHSSNAPAANSMYFTLLEHDWSVERVAPLGKDWIESYWWPIAKPWVRG